MPDRDKAIRDDFMECLKEFAPSGMERSLIRGYVLRSLWVARGFDDLYEKITGRQPHTNQEDALRALDDQAHLSLKVQDVQDWRDKRKVNAEVSELDGLLTAYRDCKKTPQEYTKELESQNKKFEEKFKNQAQTLQAKQNQPLVDLQQIIREQNGSLQKVLAVSQSVSQFSAQWVLLMKAMEHYTQQSKVLVQLCDELKKALSSSSSTIAASLVTRIETVLTHDPTASGNVNTDLMQIIDQLNTEKKTLQEQNADLNAVITMQTSFVDNVVKPFAVVLDNVITFPIVTDVYKVPDAPNLKLITDNKNVFANFTEVHNQIKRIARNIPTLLTIVTFFTDVQTKFQSAVTADSVLDDRKNAAVVVSKFRAVQNKGMFSAFIAACTQGVPCESFSTNLTELATMLARFGPVVPHADVPAQYVSSIWLQSEAPFFLPMIPSRCALLYSSLMQASLQSAIFHAALKASNSVRLNPQLPSALDNVYKDHVSLFVDPVDDQEKTKTQFVILCVLYLIELSADKRLFNFRCALTSATATPVIHMKNWFVGFLSKISEVKFLAGREVQPSVLVPVPPDIEIILKALNIPIPTS